MSRISHSTPMAAYDHIQNLLKDAAGGDAVISRADAAALVDRLEEDGRGTEALAARNIFKMIDMKESAKGARVTGYDLAENRGYVAAKLLENRDENKNGYSMEEIAKMSPTGKALVELGRVLEMDGPKGRISHDVPEKGLAHVAELILKAASKDGVASRDDIEDLKYDLYKQGRGTEQLGVAYFYGFIDARDAGDGNRVTKADVERALDYAKEHMLRNKDKNHNGYSKEELEKFSTSAKAFLLIGQMIEAGIIKA